MKSLITFLTLIFLTFAILSYGLAIKQKNQTFGEFSSKQKTDKIIKEKERNNPDTLIKTKKAAIDFAEPILFKTYGKSEILNEKPYKINFADGIWTITGTFKTEKGGVFQKGGVFLIEINSRDGKVIRMTHGK